MPSAELTKAEFEVYGIEDKVASDTVEALFGLAAIACYLGCSISTVRRLARDGMPVVNTTLSRKGATFTTKRLLDHWLMTNKLGSVEIRTKINGNLQTHYRKVA